ncbi:hypothetical protein PROFUN_07848 [Planoprotostelium fungivorum]|uniref:Uncharacterized protein n=1 Tax=Planoprotostelium fungivorum TaxID=1890364 RepID=A0A2P6NLC2_9EUKA|nr:hypothetical protein PROFUN_07848 [Planoprotostelium fungivorum]
MPTERQLLVHSFKSFGYIGDLRKGKQSDFEGLIQKYKQASKLGFQYAQWDLLILQQYMSNRHPQLHRSNKQLYFQSRTEPKAFDELPVSKLLNYLTRDNIIELIGFPNFSSLNEQVRQQTGKVSLPAAKKMLADNEQFQSILGQNNGMMQQAYNKYLAANTKVNDLTRQQQSKQFLGCVAKYTPPELNAGHINRAAVLRPPPGMKIQHLPKGIREYMQETESEEGFYKLQRIQQNYYIYYNITQLLHFTMTQWWNSVYNDVIIQLPQSILDCLKHRIQNTKTRELATYNNKKQCMKMNNKRCEERLQELLEEKEKGTMSLELQLEEMQKIIEQRDKFITKQMIVIRAYKEKLEQLLSSLLGNTRHTV